MNKQDFQQLEQNAKIYQSYECGEKLTWCSGCGNYSIQNATRMALTLEEIPPHQAMLCYDVGCNGNGSDKLTAYSIHGLHGRVIPLAAGISIANSDLHVIASAGDGATYSEGITHLVHAIRNDYRVTFLQHNNTLYALTTGQPSATTRRGMPLNSAPDGVIADPINPIEFVLSLNPTFVARTFSGDVDHMTKIIRQGLNHTGFAFIEVLQVCSTYNRINTQNWFWDRIHDVDQDPNYDNTDIIAAKQVSYDTNEKIAIGLLYHNPQTNFLHRLVNREGIKSKPVDEVAPFDVSKLMESFK